MVSENGVRVYSRWKKAAADVVLSILEQLIGQDGMLNGLTAQQSGSRVSLATMNHIDSIVDDSIRSYCRVLATVLVLIEMSTKSLSCVGAQERQEIVTSKVRRMLDTQDRGVTARRLSGLSLLGRGRSRASSAIETGTHGNLDRRGSVPALCGIPGMTSFLWLISSRRVVDVLPVDWSLLSLIACHVTIAHMRSECVVDAAGKSKVGDMRKPTLEEEGSNWGMWQRMGGIGAVELAMSVGLFFSYVRVGQASTRLNSEEKASQPMRMSLSPLVYRLRAFCSLVERLVVSSDGAKTCRMRRSMVSMAHSPRAGDSGLVGKGGAFMGLSHGPLQDMGQLKMAALGACGAPDANARIDGDRLSAAEYSRRIREHPLLRWLLSDEGVMRFTMDTGCGAGVTSAVRIMLHHPWEAAVRSSVRRAVEADLVGACGGNCASPVIVDALCYGLTSSYIGLLPLKLWVPVSIMMAQVGVSVTRGPRGTYELDMQRDQSDPLWQLAHAVLCSLGCDPYYTWLLSGTI